MDKIKRPKEVKGFTTRVRMVCGNLYITPNCDENNKLIEIFAILGKAGGCATSQLEAITRCISLGLKYGIPVEEYVDELKGISCPSQSPDALSCSDAISRILKECVNKES